MNSIFNKSRKLHELYHGRLPEGEDISMKALIMRYALIKEESNETLEAIENLLSEDTIANKAKLINELADLMVVTFGTVVALGFSQEIFEKAYEYVFRTNMAKSFPTKEEAQAMLESYQITDGRIESVVIDGETRWLGKNNVGKIIKLKGIQKPWVSIKEDLENGYSKNLSHQPGKDED